MELVILVSMIAAFFAPLYFIGRWILGPIDRAAKSRQAPARFSIADFLCLFLAIQIPMAAAYQFVEVDAKAFFWGLTILTWIFAPVIWWTCARALSKAGVSSGVHRFAFLGLVMPAVYYGLIPFLILTIYVVGSLLATDPSDIGPVGRWQYLVWFGLASGYVLCGLYTRWMLTNIHGAQELPIHAPMPTRACETEGVPPGGELQRPGDAAIG